MRLFLTSMGLPETSPNLRREFLKLVGKEPKEIRVAFVPTASEVEEDPSFSKIDRHELVEIGILEENIVD